MAEAKQTSLNRLFEEMATLMLAEQDITNHLHLRQQRGSREGLLAGLDRLESLGKPN